MSNHLVFVFLCVSRQYLSPDDSPLSALESDAEVSAAPKLNSPVEIQQVANSKISGEIVDVKKGPNPTPRSMFVFSLFFRLNKAEISDLFSLILVTYAPSYRRLESA